MHYNVPQFIEIEDRIIGPLTLKQFLILLFGGLICLMYYSIFSLSMFFFALAVPTAGVFAMLAFGKFNGRPMLLSIPNFLLFVRTPKIRIWQRTAAQNLNLVKKAPERKEPQAAPAESIPVQTRLHKLAYFLDQQSAEEERLIHSGQIKNKWLNQI